MNLFIFVEQRIGSRIRNGNTDRKDISKFRLLSSTCEGLSRPCSPAERRKAPNLRYRARGILETSHLTKMGRCWLQNNGGRVNDNISVNEVAKRKRWIGRKRVKCLNLAILDIADALVGFLRLNDAFCNSSILPPNLPPDNRNPAFRISLNLHFNPSTLLHSSHSNNCDCPFGHNNSPHFRLMIIFLCIRRRRWQPCHNLNLSSPLKNLTKHIPAFGHGVLAFSATRDCGIGFEDDVQVSCVCFETDGFGEVVNDCDDGVDCFGYCFGVIRGDEGGLDCGAAGEEFGRVVG